MSLIHQIQAVTYTIGNGPGFNPNAKGNATLTGERIISIVIGVLSIVAFVYFAIQLIFAGYEFMNAQGDPKRIEGARKRITDSILGIFIVVVAVGITTLLAKISGIPNVLDLNTFFTNLGL